MSGSVEVTERSGLLRSSSYVLIGSLIGQGAFLLASPFLARLYGPAAWGIAGSFSALLAITATGSTGRFHLAIPVVDVEDEALALYRLSGRVTLYFALLVSVLSFPTAVFIFSTAVSTSLVISAWLGLGVTFVGGTFSSTAYLTRLDMFGTLGLSRAGQGVAYAFVALALGSTGSYVGLMGGQLAGQLTAAAIVWSAVRRTRAKRRTLEALSLRNMASKYRRYLTFSLPAGTLNAASVQAQLVLMPILFTAAQAGNYALAHRLFIAPGALVAMALGSVYLGSSPGALRSGNLPVLVNGMVVPLLRASLLLGAAVVIAAPFMVTIFLGGEWQAMGRIMQLLVPWFICTVALAPLMASFAVLERLPTELGFQTSLLVTRLAAVVLGATYGSVEVAVALMSLGAVVHFMWLLIWVVRCGGGTPRLTLEAAYWPAALGIAALLLAWFLHNLLGQSGGRIAAVTLGLVLSGIAGFDFRAQRIQYADVWSGRPGPS